MTTLTMRSMFAVAALAVAAVSASAQTYKADIPMSFRAGDKVMASGSYQFRVSTGANGLTVLTVSNVTTPRAAMVLAGPGSDAPKAWREQGQPMIAFECYAGNCALHKIWTGNSRSTYDFPGLKLRRADVERIAEITVGLAKSE